MDQMKIKELFEGISPVVFYARGVISALDILSSNTIRMSPTFTKGMEAHPKYNYYLSTSRTRTGKYHADNMNYSVLFELDGRSLSNTMAGSPVDYWGEDFRKASGGAYEQEDRIFSNSPEIKNAIKYINRIDILLGAIRHDRDKSNKDVRKIVMIAKSRNIPVRLYDNKREWVVGGKGITIEEFLSRSFPEVKSISREQTEEDKYFNMRSTRKRKSDLGLIYKALVVDDKNAFTNDEWHSLSRYRSFLDAKGSVNAELHNSQNDSSLRPTLTKIGEFMRKNGMRNGTDLANYLVDKWGRA